MEEKLLVEQHIARNKRLTVVICTFMALLFAGIIFALGYIFFAGDMYIALAFALPVAIGYILITYSVSVSTVLSAAGARLANPNVREEKLFIYKVEEMSIASGLPMPKTYVQDSENINAFATGKKPQEGVICVTTGALKKLKPDELEGVMAHEMSHIKNYDIMIATVTIAVVGAIALIGEFVLRMVFYSGAGRSSGGKKGGGALPLIIIALIFAVLAPLFAKLTYLAISRRREYLADSNGAYFTRNPEGLAKALEKIKTDVTAGPPKGSKIVASLYIANPFKSQERSSIWSTHPPINERIRRLRSM